jgi:hypothetical protein
VHIVVRERGGETEYVVDTTPHPVSAPELVVGPENVDMSEAGFEARIDPLAVADGQPLPDGMWDVLIRIVIGELTVERRFGGDHAPTIDTTRRVRVVPHGDEAKTVTPYFTSWFENLSLDVGRTAAAHELRLDAEPPQWDEARPATLVIEGTTNASGLSGDSLVARLTGPEGATVDVPTSITEEAGADARYAASIDLTSADGERALGDGSWEITVQLLIPGLETAIPVPNPNGLPTIRWWRGLRPMHARVPASDDGLELRIKPVDLGRALRRRLGMG